MQKHSDRTTSMLIMTEDEIFSAMVPADHPFRRLDEILDLSEIVRPLRSLYSDLGATGIDVERGFRALLVQFWEDHSDREMERCLRENVAVRFFCGFGLTEATPSFSYLSKLRARVGADRLARLFNAVNEELRRKGLFGDVFAFVDASAIVTKTALWDERDRAIRDGEEALNNSNVGRYAADGDARWGAKSKDKIWFGYKRHHSVDMRFGLIRNVAVTPANVPDFRAVRDVCPPQGMVFMDKGYDCAESDMWVRANGCAPATIRKGNRRGKDRDLDRWRSGVRMPFEGNFSKLGRRARYRGRVKVLFQCLMEAACHNLKKAVRLLPRPAAEPLPA